jgi:hypothetical protein
LLRWHGKELTQVKDKQEKLELSEMKVHQRKIRKRCKSLIKIGYAILGYIMMNKNAKNTKGRRLERGRRR